MRKRKHDRKNDHGLDPADTSPANLRAWAAILDAYVARVIEAAEAAKTLPIIDYVEHGVPATIVNAINAARDPARRLRLLDAAGEAETKAKKRDSLAAMLAGREGAKEDAGAKQRQEAEAFRAEAARLRAEADESI